VGPATSRRTRHRRLNRRRAHVCRAIGARIKECARRSEPTNWVLLVWHRPFRIEKATRPCASHHMIWCDTQQPLVLRPASAHLPQRDTPREPSRTPRFNVVRAWPQARRRRRVGKHTRHAVKRAARHQASAIVGSAMRIAAQQVPVRTPGPRLVLTKQAAKSAPDTH
jgi:hypothetical protein